MAVVNDFEEDIEDWYFHMQDQQDLMKFLCVQKVLKGKDQSELVAPCLETLPHHLNPFDVGSLKMILCLY